jgi:hypothetical protein
MIYTASKVKSSRRVYNTTKNTQNITQLQINAPRYSMNNTSIYTLGWTQKVLITQWNKALSINSLIQSIVNLNEVKNVTDMIKVSPLVSVNKTATTLNATVSWNKNITTTFVFNKAAR